MWFPAVGGDPSWTNTEESVIVPGLGPADARDLGRDLGQDAVFVWDADGWSVHSCTHDRRVTLEVMTQENSLPPATPVSGGPRAPSKRGRLRS